MIIYKANDKGFVTEVCIMNENRSKTLESAKPYHEIQHFSSRYYNHVAVEYHRYFFIMCLPFDNHFHKMREDSTVTVEDMKLFDNCYNINERIPVC